MVCVQENVDHYNNISNWNSVNFCVILKIFLLVIVSQYCQKTVLGWLSEADANSSSFNTFICGFKDWLFYIHFDHKVWNILPFFTPIPIVLSFFDPL